MGIRTLKQGAGFLASLEDLKLPSDQLNDVLEYFRTQVLETPEIYPPVPGLPKIRCARIEKHNLNIWFGFNEKMVELLEIEDPEILS